MHMPNCNCPQCRAAAQGFEFETFEVGELQEVLGEQEELELAMELLQVQNEQELEQFLGDVFRSVGRGLKTVGSFVAKNVLPVLGPALKQIAKTALPIAGGALGSLIPIPGVGTALGSALGGAVANALEMEVAGLNREAADLERARRFVRLAASAIREAAVALGSGPPESVARTALANATIRHLPAAANAAVAILPARGGRSSPAPSAFMPIRDQLPPAMAAPIPARGQVPSSLAAGSTQTGQSGSWRRHGSHIVVEGL
jgi:hypothetical protein